MFSLLLWAFQCHNDNIALRLNQPNLVMPKRPLLVFSLSSGIFAAAFGILSIAQTLPASGSAMYTPLEEGVRQFHARRYSMAIGPLERAVSKAPHYAMGRYYLANCYVHLNRHEEAQREYDMAYRLDPFGPVSGYCRRALIGYGMSIPGESELAALGKPVAVQKAAFVAPGTVQHNAPHHLHKAVDTIRRQADFEKGRHKQSSEVFASNAAKTGEGTARKILDDADAECRAIMDAPITAAGAGPRWGVSYAHIELAKQMELQRRRDLCAEIRRKADSDANRVRAEAQDRSQKYKQYSQDRQAALDEVADSLESQLSTSRLKDRVKMRAEGTGLYVRNFGVVPSPSPEVHNSVARIRPHQSSQQPNEPEFEPTSQSSGDGGGPASGESAGENGRLPADAGVPALKVPERSVSGKVLEKNK
ncbi:MAG TPA: tetratricopeptide repeat protein [Candidatus Melainabacteria bacterium]|jgi:tetratricopeptide (TPR) repeat protein|nr:tetratricopeptide repeat protein [Candidatus Melainabacteria bacterium]